MTNQTIGFARALKVAVAAVLVFALTDATALAQRNRGNVRSSSRSNVNNRNNNVNRNNNRNTNINNNRNVNRNIDVDRDIDVDVDVNRRYGYGGCCYSSGGGAFVAGAVVGAAVTAAVVGSRVTTLPPACQVVVINGFAYQQCGSVWYQPQISGSSTTYVVINAPR
jgi:hypothetical protein